VNASEAEPVHVPLRLGTPACLSYGLVCLMLGAAVSGCSESPPKDRDPVPVRTMLLTPEVVVVSSRFSGSVEPLQTTDLAFKLPGTVQRLYQPPGLDRDVQVGDVLAKGTVIAELDEGDLRRAKAGAEARVAQLEARVATARENLEIATRVLGRFNESAGSVSEVARDDSAAKRVAAAGELASAEHALADAKVQLDQASDDYVNRQLIVPFDNATVAEKHVEPGERKAAHEVAFRLIDITTVHVTFGVPDTMIGDPAFSAPAADRVHFGQRLQITADAIEGRWLEGVVTKVAPQADPRTRTFLTELTLTNPKLPEGQLLLRPGMIVTVHVGTQFDRHVTLLPMTAIHRARSTDELSVYEVVDESGRDVVRARRVALGGVYDSQVEVVPAGSKLREGSEVVVTTAEKLTDGTLVRVMRESNGQSAMLTEAR
jgi:multidrug efflux system membrane fusion protein